MTACKYSKPDKNQLPSFIPVMELYLASIPTVNKHLHHQHDLEKNSKDYILK